MGLASLLMGGSFQKGLPGFNDSIGYSYNPTKAKALVQEYIKRSKNPKPSLTITTNENYLQFCEFIQRALLDIGLNVSIEVMPASALKTAKANGKLDFFRASWVADYPDAENYLSLFYSENYAPNGTNYTHFKNDTFDQLYKQSLSVSDNKKRLELYNQMDQMIIDDASVVVLFYDEVLAFYSKKRIGIRYQPNKFIRIEKSTKELRSAVSFRKLKNLCKNCSIMFRKFLTPSLHHHFSNFKCF
jgi:peptide/nickel transport system substrate-binding protein